MRIFFTCIVLSICLVLGSYAQLRSANVIVDLAHPEEALALGISYKKTHRYDSAKVVFHGLIEGLLTPGQEEPDVVLWAKLHLADLQIRDGKDLSAQALYTLVETGTAQENWEIVANAHVLLALVHEFVEQAEKCDGHLDQAAALIQQHQLSELYPHYAVRRSSYFRIFGISQDSALYYARDAVAHSPPEINNNTMDAYFLIGALLPDSAYEETVGYFRKSAAVFQDLGDWVGQGTMISNISGLYLENNLVDSALFYNDSTLSLLHKKEVDRIDYYSLEAYGYKDRANIYKKMGVLDSAWYYQDKYHTAQIASLGKVSAKAVAEVEARYRDEQKMQQIVQQLEEIDKEKGRRNGAILLFIIALLSAAAILYQHLRLRKVNKENRAQADRLANLDKAKSRFFANVSHELRTPLTLMIGPIHKLLQENQLTPRQVKLLGMANRNGKQLKILIDEILSLRKLDVDKMEVTPKATPLRAFFYRYLAQFESLAVSKDIQLQFEIDLADTVVGEIDPEKCRQIIYNLLSNACKFTPKDGKIYAHVWLKKEVLHMSVTDTGEGIHADDLPFIFDRYFQTNRPEKSISGGTGIGLALCKEYVTLFGGRISVESPDAQGASFHLSFPVSIVASTTVIPAEEQIQTAVSLLPTIEKQQVIQPLSNRSTILVVEDNPELSEYLKLILSTAYEVITAEDGQEALAYLFPEGSEKQASPCNLILSDLMMPVMDGYQLLEKLKSHDLTRHLPVIMLTARADEKDKMKALRIGVDDYMIKPFEEDELMVRVENLLRNQASRYTAHLPETESVVISEEDQAWLSDFEAYVQEHLADAHLSVPALAEVFSMSESTLRRQIKRLTGLAPKQYLKEVRLEKAYTLIVKRSHNSIAQVAYATGYTDTKSFSRAFKKKYRKPPSDVLSS